MLRRVLIVEDDADVAGTLAEMLGERGYEPMTVGTAAEALKVIPSFAPEALLLDVWLPGQSGPGLLTTFRQAHPKLPIIVITSEMDREILARISDLKPFYLLNKPVDPEVLHGLITDAIDPREPWRRQG